MNKSKPLRNRAWLFIAPFTLLPFSVLPPAAIAQATAQPEVEAVPAPKPPLVAPVGPGMKWQITCVSKQPAASSASGEAPKRQLKSISGERAKTVRREVYTWTDLATERWYLQQLVLATAPGRTDIIPTSYPKIPELIEERLSSFPELSWITLEHYKGVVTRKKVQCYLYEHVEVAKAVPDADELELIRQGKLAPLKDSVYLHRAWIDTATSLPVAFEDSERVMEYEFSQGNARLTPPARFLEAARKLDPSIAP